MGLMEATLFDDTTDNPGTELCSLVATYVITGTGAGAATTDIITNVCGRSKNSS